MHLDPTAGVWGELESWLAELGQSADCGFHSRFLRPSCPELCVG